jgi:hypothetical protein
MRSHGVPNYPDPNAKGVIAITTSKSLDPSSPLFEKALGDCRKLLPAGPAPTAAQQKRIERGALALAACMRSHGVPNYPNPTFSNGGVSQRLNRSAVDPNSPIFRTAQKACQRKQTPS